MQEIKRIRKEMNIPQREIAVCLNITTKTYKTWEKINSYKKKEKILKFFMNYEYKDKFLGLGVSRLSKLLNMNTGNLSVYMRSGREIKGLEDVLTKRRSELMELEVECMRLLVECSENTLTKF